MVAWYIYGIMDSKMPKKQTKVAKINLKKYKNVILFFANKIQNGTLGKVKLMKLLYFLDFDFFEKYGSSVTGDRYLRWEMGPVPEHAQKILKAMTGKEITVSKRKMSSGLNDQEHIETIDQFNLTLFSKEELLMMEKIADKWERFSGSEMKEASHGEAPWIATKPDEVIDYNLVYYRNKYGEMANI